MLRRIDFTLPLVLCLTLVGGERAAPADGPGQPLFASGLGLTPEEALNVAFRNVVQQVVAQVVDAETRTRHGTLIAGKVLSDSAGCITAYKKLDETIEDGLYQVRIAAEVTRGGVMARLKAAGVTPRAGAGDGAFTGVHLDLEAHKTAVERIRQALANYPGNCLKVQVVGKPRLVVKYDTEATFEYELKFEVDPDKYNAFLKRLLPVLEKVATHKANGSTVGKAARSQDLLAADSILEPRRLFPTNLQLQKLRWTGAKFHGVHLATVPPETDWGGKGFDPDVGLVLAVSTSHSSAHDKVNWRIYRLPRSRDYNLGLRVYVSFRDRDRKELARDVFTLMPHHGLVLTEKAAAVTAPAGQDRKAYPFGVISPYFVAFKGQDWLYAQQLVLPQRLTVSLEQLRQLDNIQCFFGHADLLRPTNQAGR